MQELALSKEVEGEIEGIQKKVIAAIQPIGFGVLTQIDFAKKVQEKLGKEINPCVILGACNPALAYEAYMHTPAAALLIPCNIVLTQITPAKVRVEVMRPTMMLDMLPELAGMQMIEKAEAQLSAALQAV